MAKKAKPHSVRRCGPFPLHRGPFLFAPPFLSKAEWPDAFRLLIERVLAQVEVSAEIFCAPDDRTARIEFDKIEMIVDGAGGMFSVDKRGSWGTDDNGSDWCGPLGPPKQFFREIENPENVARLGGDYHDVRDFSQLLYRYMEKRFARALEEGIAQVTACIDKPPAPSISIPFQQLSHLRLVDRDSPEQYYLEEDLQLDEATTANGNRIYCVGVEVIGAATAVEVVAKPLGAKVAKRRGRKPLYSEADIDAAILEELHNSGLPSHKGKWTKTRLSRKVVQKLAPNGPKKSTVDKRIPPGINAYAKLLAANKFQDSSK